MCFAKYQLYSSLFFLLRVLPVFELSMKEAFGVLDKNFELKDLTGLISYQITRSGQSTLEFDESQNGESS